jgi:hypothetical protein
MLINLFRKEKYLNISLSIIFILWLFYHLITISISPLPNFDEVFFSNISNNLFSKGGLYLSIGKTSEEDLDLVLAYGPIYFYLHGFIIKLIGLNIITGRVLSLVSGFFIFLFFLYFSKKIFENTNYLLAFVLLLLTDYRFNMNMHSGRMDLLAVLFFIFSLYFFFKSRNGLTNVYSGIFISLAFLTTPRISFYFLSLFFLLIYDFFSGRRNIFKYLTIGVVSSFIILFWIYFKFGSIDHYIQYLNNLENYGEKNTSSINKHLGINGLSFHLVNPAFISLYITYGILFYYKMFDRITLFLLVLILSHVLFIFEQASYSAMILPFVYWVLVFGLKKIKNIYTIHNYLKKMLLILLFFNLTIFVFKTIFLIMSSEGRNINYIEQKLLSYNFSEKKVLSNYEYFYFVNEKKGIFTSIELVNEKLNDSSLNKFQYAILDMKTAVQFENKFGKHIKTKLILKNKRNRDSFLTNFFSRKFNVYLSYDGYFYVLR